jgi:hypothetical protein
VVNGIFQAFRRIRLTDPLIRNATPRIRNEDIWVSRVLMSAIVLQMRMAASARIIPGDFDVVIIESLKYVRICDLFKNRSKNRMVICYGV